MIKNVILDMGNVLITFDPEVSINKYCKIDEEKDIIRKELFQSKEWIMSDGGEIKNNELFDRVKNRVPEKFHESLKNCAEHWDICTTPIKGAKEFCDYIKKKKYGMYILSNANEKFYEYFPNSFSLDLFDGIVLSSQIHIVKPNEGSFKYVLDKYKLNPEECLFIDDKDYNVVAAEKLNIKAEVFTDNFNEKIKKYNL